LPDARREVGVTFTLREQSEAYASDFAAKSGAPRPENTAFWEKTAEK